MAFQVNQRQCVINDLQLSASIITRVKGISSDLKNSYAVTRRYVLDMCCKQTSLWIYKKKLGLQLWLEGFSKTTWPKRKWWQCCCWKENKGKKTFNRHLKVVSTKDIPLNNVQMGCNTEFMNQWVCIFNRWSNFSYLSGFISVVTEVQKSEYRKDSAPS